MSWVLYNMLDIIFLERRLERIRGYHNDLNELFALQDSFPRKLFFYYAVERAVQLLVDEMIDVNNHIIDRQNFRVPDDFQSTFQILEQNNVLESELAHRLAPIVGLRNRLVHRYESIDRELMVQMAINEKEDFQTYAASIEVFMRKKSMPDKRQLNRLKSR